MRFCFLERKRVWWPTWQGWLAFSLVAASLLIVAFRNAENFLSVTDQVPAEVLVVEGWICEEALRGAAKEFQEGGYQWLVTVGGWPGYATNTVAYLAAMDLARMGCPTNRILIGLPNSGLEDRTYENATSARQILRKRQIEASGVMVFTRGSHARRSRLVFQKAFGTTARIGVISYCSDRENRQPWWNSTVRSKEVIEEFLGWLRERLGPGFREQERKGFSVKAVIERPGSCALERFKLIYSLCS